VNTVALSQKEALVVIAEELSTAKATPAELRSQAVLWEKDALRDERVAEGSRSKRRRASLMHRASQTRGAAKTCRLAAAEIEKRGAHNVEEAMENRVLRFLRQMLASPKRYRSTAS
jgi:hypothetical protein